jgi:hypothetical protein
MARHFLEIDEANTVQSGPFLRAQRLVADCAGARAIGVVHGVAGLGKTYAVEAAAVDANVPATWVVFAGRPSYTRLVRSMFKELTGVEPHGELWKLTDDLRDVLSEKPRMIVVDEAQQLNGDAFEFLRFLHDDAATDFALVFVGGNGCWKVISRYPMLLSRVYREVKMRNLTEEEVVALIPRYHPVHARADIGTLMLIDEQFAHGTFRLWATFTKTIADLCEARGLTTYDERLALAALSLLPEQSAA